MNDNDSGQSIVSIVVEKYQHELFTYCRKRLPNYHDAEDICQEVFAILYEKWDLVKDYDYLSTWLKKTANNRIMKFLHKNRNWKLLDVSVEDLLIMAPSVEDSSLCEIKSLVNEKEWNSIREHYGYGRTYKEMAAKEKISVDAISMRFHRIKLKIAKHYNIKMSKKDQGSEEEVLT
ncbi:MAG TPA: sigma-70 family RNA polymerase sigma factor [Firmicutes bacterium]|nr:sigma-70 family RNA polymerase sigma factor [Bacillota bacterium]